MLDIMSYHLVDGDVQGAPAAGVQGGSPLQQQGRHLGLVVQDGVGQGGQALAWLLLYI